MEVFKLEQPGVVVLSMPGVDVVTFSLTVVGVTAGVRVV